MKKTLLHLIPYEEFVPPQNGGALRCYHLCKELSKYYDVTLITFQDKSSFTNNYLEGVKIINPKHQSSYTGLYHKLSNAFKHRFYLKTLKGPAEATVLSFYPVLKELSKTASFDIVLMEHLSSIALGSVIKRLFPNAIRLADQHNVDHLLYQQNHELSQPKHQNVFKLLKQQEARLYKNADYILACSKPDMKTLMNLNQNKISGFVVPNGTSLKLKTARVTNIQATQLLFCGSLDYAPNRNGLLWFYQKVWPQVKRSVKDISLTVIGRNGTDCVYEPLLQDPQINFIGTVGDVAPYYLKSQIAIVPLLEGSGTRLKILEAMSYGVPVISTSIGAEGIDYEHADNIIIADTPEEFEKEISKTIDNHNRLESLSKEGLKLINNSYNWKHIVKCLINDLNKIP